eukprot:TRINITY_DN6953_c0_g1_i3.p1 TRINITY_DN6953_c0_g1~~TRINITY_DN6953_c0_g1_i3.p1  ORF type:complete len:339 (+),score=44.36 TRINITY_DN6953_c0_g1_i3:83-1099(+)
MVLSYSGPDLAALISSVEASKEKRSEYEVAIRNRSFASKMTKKVQGGSSKIRSKSYYNVKIPRLKITMLLVIFSAIIIGVVIMLYLVNQSMISKYNILSLTRKTNLDVNFMLMRLWTRFKDIYSAIDSVSILNQGVEDMSSSMNEAYSKLSTLQDFYVSLNDEGIDMKLFDTKNTNLCTFFTDRDKIVDCNTLQGGLLTQGLRKTVDFVMTHFIHLFENYEVNVKNNVTWVMTDKDLDIETLLNLVTDLSFVTIELIDQFIMNYLSDLRTQMIMFFVIAFIGYIAYQVVYYLNTIIGLSELINKSRSTFAIMPFFLIRKNRLLIKYIQDTSGLYIISG